MHDSADLWSEALVRDVNNRAAVIVPLPHDFEPWPQGFNYDEEFTKILGQYIDRSVGAMLGPRKHEGTHASFYHVGPMAQSYPMYMFTLVRDAISLLADVGGLITLAQIAHAALEAARAWYSGASSRLPERQSDYIRKGLRVMMSEPLIVGLCYEHFASHYRCKNFKIDRSFRDTYDGYSTAQHPGGEGHYTIRFWTGRISYVYLIDCYGDPIDHFQLHGKMMEQLEMPNSFGTDARTLSVPQVIRSTDVICDI